MAATPSEWTAAIAFRSSSRRALAAAAFCWELASCVMASSVSQYFRSPQCLLAEVAALATDTKGRSPARGLQGRISYRISSAAENCDITSEYPQRQINR